MMARRVRLNADNDPLSQTDQVLAGFEQFNQSGSQQAGKSTSWEASQLGSQLVSKLTGQEVGFLTSQPPDKLNLRKATFQLNEALLERLDTFLLQLQLQLGKANAPYKEVIVEEAIAQLLDQALNHQPDVVAALQERQLTRTAAAK
jgi:hypothetical protein